MLQAVHIPICTKKVEPWGIELAHSNRWKTKRIFQTAVTVGAAVCNSFCGGRKAGHLRLSCQGLRRIAHAKRAQAVITAAIPNIAPAVKVMLIFTPPVRSSFTLRTVNE